jgi:hypothetical protein
MYGGDVGGAGIERLGANEPNALCKSFTKLVLPMNFGERLDHKQELNPIVVCSGMLISRRVVQLCRTSYNLHTNTSWGSFNLCRNRKFSLRFHV